MTEFGSFDPLVALLSAVMLDLVLGEPRRFHPLVGLGWMIRQVEGLCYGKAPSDTMRLRGLVAVLLLLAPLAALASCLQHFLGVAFSSIVLYFSIAPRSLREHAMQVAGALEHGDLREARLAAGKMVSRETGRLDEAGVARATIESVLENGSDAIFAAMFWFVLAGAPGVLFYRASNTLDAMWGYRNARYNEFGWAAARLDDLLNFIPARLTAISYALLGHVPSALRCWSRQAPKWDSPNAGPVMASGAGALQVRLGGLAIYGGECCDRPLLGCGRDAECKDIFRAVRLVQRTLYLWLLVLCCAVFVPKGWHA